MCSVSKQGDSDRWVFYGFLGLLLWSPLPLASNRPWLWSFLGLCVFLLAFWWLIEYFRGHVKTTASLRKSIIPIAILLGWLCLLLFQSVTGSTVAPFVTKGFLLQSTALVIFFILALLLIRSRRRLNVLAWTIVISGAFQAFYGGLMAMSGLEYGFFIEKKHYRGLATGTFVNRNHMAGYLEMSLAVGVGLLLASVNEIKVNTLKQRIRSLVSWLLSSKMQLRVLLAIMVVGLVLTHSRMGNTAFFISLFISGCLWLLLEKKKPKRGVAFLLTTLFLLDIVIIGSWFGIEKVVDRLEQTSSVSESRDEVVRDSLLYLDDFMLTGSGGGTFEHVFPQYRGADIASDYDYAHNDFMQFAVETGLVGVGLLGLFVITTTLMALKVMQQGKRSLHRGMAFASFMAILAIMIHSSVDFNLQIPANALLFMALLSFPWVADIEKRA